MMESSRWIPHLWGWALKCVLSQSFEGWYKYDNLYLFVHLLEFICLVHLLGTFNLIDNQEWLHNSPSSIPSFKNKDINLSENIFSLSVREFFGGGKYLYLCCFPVGTMLGWVWVWAYWLELTVRRIFWQHLLVCSTEYQMEFRPWIYYCQDQSMSLGSSKKEPDILRPPRPSP